MKRPSPYVSFSDISRHRRARIHLLAKKVGVPLEYRTMDLQWDGKAIAVGLKGHLEVADVLHEIAHFQVCRALDPERLKCPDFGLGPGSETIQTDLARNLNVRDSDIEEGFASLLGISYEWYLGYNFRRTLSLHSWEMHIGKGQLHRISWDEFLTNEDVLYYPGRLQEMGLMKDKYPALCFPRL